MAHHDEAADAIGRNDFALVEALVAAGAKFTPDQARPRPRYGERRAA